MWLLRNPGYGHSLSLALQEKEKEQDLGLGKPPKDFAPETRESHLQDQWTTIRSSCFEGPFLPWSLYKNADFGRDGENKPFAGWYRKATYAFLNGNNETNNLLESLPNTEATDQEGKPIELQVLSEGPDTSDKAEMEARACKIGRIELYPYRTKDRGTIPLLLERLREVGIVLPSHQQSLTVFLAILARQGYKTTSLTRKVAYGAKEEKAKLAAPKIEATLEISRTDETASPERILPIRFWVRGEDEWATYFNNSELKEYYLDFLENSYAFRPSLTLNAGAFKTPLPFPKL